MIKRSTILRVTGVAGLAAIAGMAALPVSAQMMASASGMFEGRSNHVTTGSVEVITEDGRTFVELGDDFMLDGGPDPHVAFGKDGEYIVESELGALLSLTGKQRYALSSTMSAADYNEVYIWCNVAGVPLGVASLK